MKEFRKIIALYTIFIIYHLTSFLFSLKKNFKKMMYVLEGEDSDDEYIHRYDSENSQIICCKAAKRLRYAFRPYKLIQIKYDKKMEYPRERSGHRILCTNSDIYLLGGFNPDIATIRRPATTSLLREYWKYNIATGRWKLILNNNSQHMPRELASNAIVTYKNTIITHGGTGFPFGEECSNKTHVFGTKVPLVSKLKCTGDLPLPQYGPALVVHDNHMYTIGGTTGFDYFCDIYRLNLKTKVWSNIYTSRPEMREDPQGRYRHETIYTGTHIFILGGGTHNVSFDLEKLPAFNLEKNVWEYVDTKPDPALPPEAGFPEPRKCYSCVQYTNTDDSIEAIVCGGLGNSNKYLADIWKLKLDTLTWMLIKSDKLRKPTYFHSAATSGNGAMFIFGGIEVRNTLQRTNDLYKMWTTIPKLSEMCWDALTYYDSYLDRFTKQNLLTFGIPMDFAKRVQEFDSSNAYNNRTQYDLSLDSPFQAFQSAKRFRSMSQ